MMRIAGATFSFGPISLETSATILRDLGFSWADVGAGWSNYQQVLPEETLGDPSGQADRVCRVMDEHGLRISELFVMQFEHAINHPTPGSRRTTLERFRGMTVFAQQAGFESIMMIPGSVHEDMGQSAQGAFDTSVEVLREMVRIAGDHAVQCNIEPCVGSVAHAPADALALCAAVPGLGLTLDYAHQVQLGLGHEAIEPLHAHARHLHAKQSAPGAFQARPDEGVIDFARIMRKLQADDYDGVICVEFVTNPAVVEAGWNVEHETGKLKRMLEDGLAASG